MIKQTIQWQQDGLDPRWYTADGVGSIRNSASYRPGGWWFLLAWLPGTKDYDIGPFRTKAQALSEAIRLAAEQSVAAAGRRS